ncbi:MAG: oligosaccharide flippase family protein [Aeromicrobium sp.]
MSATVRSNLALSLANSTATRLGNLVLGIVLARLLAPGDFGVYAIGLTVLAVLSAISELGFTADLVRTGNIPARAPTLLTIGLAFSSGLALLTWATAEPLAAALGSVEAAPVLKALSICLVLSGVSAVPMAILQRRFQQGRQLLADALSFVISTVLVLVMIEWGWGVMSLAWSRVAAQVVTVVALCLMSGYRPRFGLNPAVARQSLRFGLPLTAANLLSWALLSIDNVVISRGLGSVALGFYVLAFNISSWPMTALGQAIRAVALPAFARLHERSGASPPDGDGDAVDEARLRRERGRALQVWVALTWSASLPIGVLLFVLATPLVVAVYGTKWENAAPALAALAAFGALRPLFDTFATFLVSRGRTARVLMVQVVWAVLLVPSTVVGVRMGGIAGAGWAHVVVSLTIILPFYLLLVRSEIDGVLALLRMTLPPLAAAVPAALCAWVVAASLERPWLALLCGGVVGLGVYLLPLTGWLLRMGRPDDVLSSSAPAHPVPTTSRRHLT